MNNNNYPSSAYAWYVVVLLTLAYIISFIDRQILGMMVELIKADFSLSDTQLALLGGLAFGLFYAVLGVPIGRLVDRGKRTRIIVIGMTIWCFMTAACGLAKSFVHLFLARVGVGVGEATLSPAALSIISDNFPKEKRTIPLGIYNVGIYVGSGLAFILGGLVIDYLQSMPALRLPLVGDLRPWQAAFLAVGLPGLLVAALFWLTVEEPSRKDVFQSKDSDDNLHLSVREVFDYLKVRWKTYIAMGLGMAGMVIITYTNLYWITPFFQRIHGWDIRQVGITYGPIILLAGPLGIYLGGICGNWLMQRGHKNGLIIGGIIGAIILIPSTMLFPLMQSEASILTLLFVASFAPAFITANIVPAMMAVTPNQMRGQVYAILLLVMNIFGLVIGPLFVGLCNDFVFLSGQLIHHSLALVTGTAGVICLLFFIFGLKPYKKDMLQFEQALKDEVARN